MSRSSLGYSDPPAAACQTAATREEVPVNGRGAIGAGRLALLLASLLLSPPAAADLAPPDYRAYHGQRAYAESLLALRTGQTDTALAAAARTVELLPDDPDALYLLGMCQLFAGRQDEARVSLERVLVLRPDLVEAHHDLGLIWLSIGEPAAAAASFQRVAELRPDSWIAPYRLAQVAGLLQGDLPACEGHLARAVELGYPGAASLPVDPDWAKLAGDPAFVAMIQRLLERGDGLGKGR
jgi:tetratricopeptide (TPR) repeat protein